MEKLKELINLKIEEIENYNIDTQENEERYIHEINCLVEPSIFSSVTNKFWSNQKGLTYPRNLSNLLYNT